MVEKRFIWLPLLLAAGLVLLVASKATVVAESYLTPNEQLGKSIFFDDRLSINQNQSCAACHGPEEGWTGPDSAINAGGSVYEGSIPGRFGDRKPPSSAYATQSPILHYMIEKKEALFVGGNFWDGRATGEYLGNPAADQARGPFLNPVEQALFDWACVVYKVCTADYEVGFEDVWGDAACDIAWPADVETACATEDLMVDLSAEDRNTARTAYDQIALSIAAFEASPESNAFTSKFDFTKVGRAHLTLQERKGFALFNGKGRCKSCHPSHGRQPLFTDYTFDNLGIPKNPENPVYNLDPAFVDPGLGGFLFSRDDYKVFASANDGKHKVPTLRNVGKVPYEGFVKAYGHNGYFKSLWGLVHFYNTRDVKAVCPGAYTEAQALAADCWPVPEVVANVNTTELGNLGLTPEEEAAIVAFLNALSDGYVP